MRHGNIEFNTTPLDVKASGNKVTLTAGENVAFGDVCYVKSDGKAWLVDATDITKGSGLVMAIATISGNVSGAFLTYGVARNDAWNWTVGGLIFITITGTTTNTLSQTKPTATDEVVQVAGVATHADRMFFAPQLVQVELE